MRRSSPEHCLEVGVDLFRRHGWRVALDHAAIAVHQEFREIPWDVRFAVVSRRLGGKPLVEITGPFTVDLDLLEHREGRAVLRTRERLDLRVRAWLLGAELVAGKREHDSATRVVLLMQSTQPGVLRRETSAGGDVDDNARLAGEGIKADGITVDTLHGEFVEVAHCILLVQEPLSVWPSMSPGPSANRR